MISKEKHKQALKEEEEYSQMLVNGYTKKPKILLSLLVFNLFYQVDTEEYLFHVKQFVSTTTLIVGKENIEEVCSKIADLIMRNRKDATSSDKDN